MGAPAYAATFAGAGGVHEPYWILFGTGLVVVACGALLALTALGGRVGPQVPTSRGARIVRNIRNAAVADLAVGLIALTIGLLAIHHNLNLLLDSVLPPHFKGPRPHLDVALPGRSLLTWGTVAAAVAGLGIVATGRDSARS